MAFLKMILAIYLFSPLNGFSKNRENIDSNLKVIEGFIFRMSGVEYISAHPFTTFPKYRIEWKDKSIPKNLFSKIRTSGILTKKYSVLFDSMVILNGEKVLKQSLLTSSKEEIDKNLNTLQDLVE